MTDTDLLYGSDTGEHIENEKHELEYVPFPTCNETGKPLELKYGIEDGMLPLASDHPRCHVCITDLSLAPRA
jgi:hypothetical protein